MTEIYGYYISHIFQQKQAYNIYIGQHRDSPTTVMIKTYDIRNKTKQEINQLLKIINIQKNLKNPFILPILRVYQFSNFIVTIHPFCQYGSLEQQIGDRWKQNDSLKEKQIQYFLTQILIGMKAIKDAGIISRNISTNNIYIKKSKKYQNGQIQLDCFDNCILANQTNGISGELVYSSYQMLTQQYYNCQNDIFNLGVVLYRMMTKYFPFTGKDQQRLIKQQKNNHIRRITEKQYSEEFKQLVYSMLQINQNERPNIEQLLQNDLINSFLYQFGYVNNYNNQLQLIPKLIEHDTQESTKSE